MLGYNTKEEAHHEHDCGECTYKGSVELAPGKWVDFYACPNGPGRTYIGRHGGSGPDYTSMNAMVLSDLDHVPADPILAALWLMWARDQQQVNPGREGGR